MLRIDIVQADIDRMTAAAGATGRQIEQARANALRKMRAPIRAAVRKAVAKARRIPERAMDGRIFSSEVPAGAEELKVWIGTRNIDLFAAGTPRQTKAGVTVGRLRYPGAFIARIYSEREQVWIRLRSRHYDPELYPTRHRPGDNGLAELRGRFPVVRAAIPIDDIVQKVLEDGEEGFRQQFMKIFAHELDYYVNIRGMH